MLTRERRHLILEALRSDGRVVARDLAQQWELSEDTIRRDLREMASEGLLARVHGGALPLSPPLPDFTARQQLLGDVKERMGWTAVSLFSAGQTVFLDGGTSTAAIIRHLPPELALTIVTHSPTIAAALEHHRAVEVILVGGQLFKHSMVAVGSQAAAQIAAFRPDIFILGVTALHPVYGLTTGDFEEAGIKRLIAAQSAQTVTLATADKIDAISPHRIAPVSELSTLVVPPDVEEARLAAYRKQGVEIMRSD